MKNRICKKIISSLMCIGILLSMVPAMQVSAEYDYGETIDIVTSLNIVPDRFSAEEEVTRQELAKFIYYMLNVKENGAIYADETFYDVDISNEYYEYISVMCGYDLMVGVGNGLFSPETKATLAMVVRVIINATGYYPLARDGSIDAYSKVAADLGILDNVVYNQNKIATKGELAQIIWNTMQLNTVETAISGKRTQVVTDKTLLWNYHRITDAKGFVTANERTFHNREESIGEGLVRIDNTIYYAGTDRVGEMLGRNIRFYYKVHDDYDKSIVMWAKVNDSNELNFEAKQIKNVNQTTFTAKVGEKDKEYALSSVVNVIFNGKYRAFDSRDLMPTIGSVRLVDADGDRVYELAEVKSYIPYVVRARDAENLIIYDMASKQPLDISDKAEYEIKSYGARIKFDEIEMGNVVLVAADKTTYDINGVMAISSVLSSVYELIVTNDTVTGTVTSVDGSEKIAVIDGKEYDIRATYDYTGATTVRTGVNKRFYVDAFGNIVYVGNETSGAGSQEGRYGFVTKVRYNTNEDVITMRVFDKDSNWYTYNIAKKVRIDGTTYKNNNAIHVALTSVINGKIQPSIDAGYLMMYKLNDEGEVKFVDTADVGNNEIADETFSLDLPLAQGQTYHAYQGYFTYKNIVDRQFVLTAQTPLLEVPVSLQKKTNGELIDNAYFSPNLILNIDDEENYRWGVQHFDDNNNNNNGYNMQIFESDEAQRAGIIVSPNWSGDSSVVLGAEVELCVVTDKIITINEDNEIVTKFTVLGPTGERSIYSTPETKVVLYGQWSTQNGADNTLAYRTVDDIDVGNIIRYNGTANKANIINIMFQLYDDAGNMPQYSYEYDDITGISEGYSVHMNWGELYRLEDDMIKIRVGASGVPGGLPYNVFTHSRVYRNIPVICFDVENNTAEIIDSASARDFVKTNSTEQSDKVFMRRYWGAVYEIFLFRNVPARDLPSINS